MAITTIADMQIVSEKFILDCSPCDGDFVNAKLLEIIDKNKNTFNTGDFVLEKSKPCFSNGGTPWVMLNSEIPNNFLQAGNEIVFK